MTITVTGSGITFSDGTTMNTDYPIWLGQGSFSGTSTTISGIPSDARIVWLYLSSCQTSGTGLWRVSVSTGSSYSSSWTNTNTTSVASVVGVGAANWVLNNSNAATYTWNSQFTFIKHDTSPNALIMSGTGATNVTGRQFWTGGSCTITSFTSITVDNSAGNTQVGSWSVYYA